ncbi:hypothetical protein MLD38_025583 [Melastoma candidum]|uniref:Uncharacterized protein n=1 Tax=Melastoma candidum TaxID=119954 RepID=A0ACB9NWS4_9MYRT|nr:hypothetical protein MLD38_025583 [Melastoma candidum]
MCAATRSGMGRRPLPILEALKREAVNFVAAWGRAAAAGLDSGDEPGVAGSLKTSRRRCHRRRVWELQKEGMKSISAASCWMRSARGLTALADGEWGLMKPEVLLKTRVAAVAFGEAEVCCLQRYDAPLLLPLGWSSSPVATATVFTIHTKVDGR